MTQQLTLFDAPPSPKLARSSDPQTSHESAAKTQTELPGRYERILRIMAAYGKPMTARQIHHEAHKRMLEMVKDGWIEVCGTTRDETTGRTVMIYRRVK